METIKSGNDAPKTMGQIIENVGNTKKKVVKSILSYTGLLIELLLVVAVIVVFTTDVQLDTAVGIAELGLSIFVLVFCAYLSYINCSNSGIKAGKLTKIYTDTTTTYDTVKKVITDKKIQARINEFGLYYRKNELINSRSTIIADYGIEYNEYKQKYLGKDKKTIEELEDLSKDAKKAILAANNTKSIDFNAATMLKRGRKSARRSPLGSDPKRKRAIQHFVRFVTTLFTCVVTGVIALEMLVDPSWNTFAECLLKLLPVVINAFLGYKMGYENITIDTVNYMNDQIDLMRQFINYVEEYPTPQNISVEEKIEEVKDTTKKQIKKLKNV